MDINIFLACFISAVIGAIIGAIIGYIFAAILISGGHLDDLQATYDKGFDKGKEAALKNVNDLYNKYKELDKRA